MLKGSGRKLSLAAYCLESAYVCAPAICNQRNFSSILTASLDRRNGDTHSGFNPQDHSLGGLGASQGLRGFSASGLSEDSGNQESISSTESPAEPGPDSFSQSTSPSSSFVDDSDDLYGPNAIQVALNAAETSALTEAWDEAWFVNKGIQLLVQYVHSATGTQWWESIALTTLGLRAATMPLVVKQLQNTVKMTQARPELAALKEWFEQKQSVGQGKEVSQEYMARMGQIMTKYDCSIAKNMLPILTQAPIFIGFFGALRSLAMAKVPSFTTGGIPVTFLGTDYSNLTMADPYYVLPIVSSLIFLVSVELNAADGMQGQDQATLKRTKNFMRVLGVAMVPLTGSMPMSIFCYWITSNLYSLVQSSVFKLDTVRRFFKLPTIGEMEALAVSTSSQPSSSTPSESFMDRFKRMASPKSNGTAASQPSSLFMPFSNASNSKSQSTSNLASSKGIPGSPRIHRRQPKFRKKR